MNRGKPLNKSEVDRVERWKRALIEDLGEDLRLIVRTLRLSRCVTVMSIVQALRRCGTAEALLRGVELYWMQLAIDAARAPAADEVKGVTP